MARNNFEKGLYDSVINANFIDNKNEFYGGAIYSLGDIKRCVFNGAFRHNSADALSDNHLYGFGGAIRVNGNIEDCIFNADFINNTAGTWGYSMGGAIDAVNILNSIFAGKFIDNSAGYEGGAIDGNLLNCNLSGDFINNYARIYGGVIDGNLLNCIFSGYFANNVAYYGGAVFSKYIKNSIFNGDFVNNTALEGDVWGGGAIAAYNNITNSIFSGNFINNSAAYRGGAIFSQKILDSTFNGTFKGNVINYEFGYEYSYGGAIYGSQIDHCIFYGKYIDNKATYGGAVFVQNIDYCTFNAYYNGNVAIYGNVLWTFWFYSCAEFEVTRHNSANIPDSDIYDKSKKSLEDRYSCSGEDDLLGTSLNEIYVDGSALSNGDGNINNPYNNLKSAIVNANDRDTIYIAPGTYVGENNIGLTINKPLNLIKNGKGEVVFDSENTGRIFTINNDSFNITGLTFTHATDSAIVFNNGLFNSKIEANFYDNKKANGDGAALYIHGYVFNCVFNGDYIGNSAVNGGAVCADEIISSKFNGVFTNNSANIDGGVIKATFIDTVINGAFTNNTAKSNGGAIKGNVANSVINGNFKNNVATNGGAIYANISSSIITGDFKGNGATNGGSIYGKISSSNFTGDFNDNSAVNGGAIYGAISNSNFKCNFMKNNADKGSAAYSNKDISKSLFKGSFTDNTAVSDNGKLVYVEGSISNSNFIGDVFVNSSNINEIVYSLKGLVVNCVFSNASTNDPDNTQQSETNTTRDNDSGREDDIIYDVADVKVVMKQSSVLYTGKYSVIIQGKDGKTASGISVMFKINGKTVKTAKTNSKGVATFNIPSKYVPKKYTIKAIVFGMSSSKKVTVKQILKIKTVKVKKSAKKLVLTATLKKVDGKYLKGKKITFKFNGKKFVVKTNKKEKLKVGKKVTYQETYLKDTVKKTVKVKK